MKFIMIPFEDRLRRILDALGLSSSKFAELHGISRVSMHKMLQGHTRPGLETLERICLSNPRISAEFLLTGEGGPLLSNIEQAPKPQLSADLLLMEVEFLKKENERVNKQFNILMEQQSKLLNHILSTKDLSFKASS